MAKRLLKPRPFFWALSLVISLSSTAPLAQENPALDAIYEKAEQIDRALSEAKQVSANVTGLDPISDLSQLSAFGSSQSELMLVTNHNQLEEGVVRESFYFDHNQLILYKRSQESDERLDAENQYFSNGHVIGWFQRQATRHGNQPFDLNQIPGEPVEFDSESTDCLHEQYTTKVKVIGALIKGFSQSSLDAGQLNVRLMLDSIAPDGQHLVGWRYTDNDQSVAEHFLVRVKDGQTVASLPGTFFPAAITCRWPPCGPRMPTG